jgi:ABC-type nitrate/sulfonate/bicarbonate transport system substrate-binding protein
MTRPELLETERAAFTALVRVLRRGIDFLKTNPAEALAVYARHTKASADDTLGPKLFAATLPCFTYDLSMTTEAYALLARWLLETGQVKTPVDVSRAWTNRLALV